jgi:multiple sugar transport system ATP-binding protein
VSFAFDEAALYLFDPETGASLKTKRDGVVPATPDSIPNREGAQSTTGRGPDAGPDDDQIEGTIE